MRITSNELPIDEKLLRALKPQAEALARSMDLKGTIGFTFETWCEIPEGPKHQRLQLQASRGGLRDDCFPFALTNVHGEMETALRRLGSPQPGGLQRRSCVTGGGALKATPQGDEVTLRRIATNVPLEG